MKTSSTHLLLVDVNEFSTSFFVSMNFTLIEEQFSPTETPLKDVLVSFLFLSKFGSYIATYC